MTITIRRAAPQDRPDWERLWRGYQAFYNADLSADEDALWRRLMAPGPDGPFCLLAVDENGAVIGMAQYLFHATTWSQAPRCYLNDLFTDPEARGGGAGRALIEAVYQAADAQGCGRTYWLTQTFNQQARALYDKVASQTPFMKYER